MLRLCAALSLAAGACGHGLMTLPFSRNGGTIAIGGTIASSASASWYTSGIHAVGPRTLPKKMQTTTYGGGNNPWSAPGTAPLKSPCGNMGAYGPGGQSLPRLANRTVWQRGATAQAAWAIFQNHAGGYSYRLCPASEEVTEECFQQHPLRFVDATSSGTSTIRFALDSINAGKKDITIPAVTTHTGTVPAGSQWRRNPIPTKEGGAAFAAPFPGGEGDMDGFSIVDDLVVPADIATGDYLLSWRWDCEVTSQVWANCADVTITDGPAN